MSNIEYLRQLHHDCEKDSIPRKGDLFLQKDLVFWFCVKDLIFIYYGQAKKKNVCLLFDENLKQGR